MHVTSLDSGWFTRLPEDFRSALTLAGKSVVLPVGERLNSSDAEARSLIGVVSGQIAVSLPLPNGALAVSHVATRGSWFGYGLVASPDRNRLEIIDARTEANLFVVPLNKLRQLLEQTPSWWAHIARLQADNCDLLTSAFIDLMLRGHRARLIALLLRLAGLRPDQGLHAPGFRIPVSQEELATMSNCSHNFANAELRQLAATGCIEIKYRSIRLIDPAALARELKAAMG